eukprot:16449891-Heterocapsa_arctica.AAC.1
MNQRGSLGPLALVLMGDCGIELAIACHSLAVFGSPFGFPGPQRANFRLVVGVPHASDHLGEFDEAAVPISEDGVDRVPMIAGKLSQKRPRNGPGQGDRGAGN